MFRDAMPVNWIGPGKTEGVQVDGLPVAIANVDGAFFAFQSLCPREGTTLGGRTLERRCIITCPHHLSRYDVTTGRCVTSSSLDGNSEDLITFPTRVVEGVVQVDV